MAEQVEARVTDIESKIEGMDEQMKHLMELIKEKAVKTPIEDPQDSIYPPGFTPQWAPIQETPFQDSGLYDGIHFRHNPTYEGTKTLTKEEDDAHKLETIEKRLRAVEGGTIFGSLSVDDLCLVPDVVIPSDFKVPDFVKYDGTSCPITHITFFLRKIQPLTKDEKIWMALFQESLTKSALQWYLSQGPKNIKTWNDLAQAFINNYKHVMDLAPDHQTLQNMEKNKQETFKEYAQRWRDLAAQVRPPMIEKEMITLFIQTLKGPFYDKLVGNTPSGFSDMVLSGERIEFGIKIRKLVEPSTGGFHKERGRAVQNIISDTHGPTPLKMYRKGYPNEAIVSGSFPHSTSSLIQDHKPQGASPKKKEEFDPIPILYTELYLKLIESQLIQPMPTKQIQPPYPRWYDVNAICEYHGGIAGHSLENCFALKRKVQQLLEAKLLDFTNGP